MEFALAPLRGEASPGRPGCIPKALGCGTLMLIGTNQLMGLKIRRTILMSVGSRRGQGEQVLEALEKISCGQRKI
jgi:hypothetical protein